MAGKKSSSEKNETDFHETTLAVEQHGKEIADIGTRLSSLEGKLTTSEQIATTLKGAAKDSKALDKLFSEIFCEMLKKDDDVKEAITEHITKIDRNSVNSTLKKWGGLFGAGVIYVLGLLTSVLVNWIAERLSK